MNKGEDGMASKEYRIFKSGRITVSVSGKYALNIFNAYIRERVFSSHVERIVRDSEGFFDKAILLDSVDENEENNVAKYRLDFSNLEIEKLYEVAYEKKKVVPKDKIIPGSIAYFLGCPMEEISVVSCSDSEFSKANYEIEMPLKRILKHESRLVKLIKMIGEVEGEDFISVWSMIKYHMK